MTDRLRIANEVLHSFAPDTTIERRRGGWYVVFSGRGWRWQVDVYNCFAPSWYRRWARGANYCMALSLLVRWVKGQPVPPLSRWLYWASDAMRMIPTEMVARLRAAGWPEQVDCIKCDLPIAGAVDWWHTDRQDGPCHMFGECGMETILYSSAPKGATHERVS